MLVYNCAMHSLRNTNACLLLVRADIVQANAMEISARTTFASEPITKLSFRGLLTRSTTLRDTVC